MRTDLINFAPLDAVRKAIAREFQAPATTDLGPVVLLPSVYDHLEAKGWDMRNYIRQQPLSTKGA